jgi:SAM-dependent methyltransferase
MNIYDITENNRKAWNEASKYHQKARGEYLTSGFLSPDFTTLNRDCDNILIEKIKSINLNDKIISQLPCNNGRELLSLMRFGAKKAVGFDISDNAINEARNLARISNINADFFRMNILDINDDYNNMFDFIYISEGSLQWFPDLDNYFRIVAKMLKAEGNLLIYEMHPFAYSLEQVDDKMETISLNELSPYFEKGPYNYDQGLDYVGEIKYKAQKCYWFMHTISDIINGIIRNEMGIIEFNELRNEMGNNPVAKKFDKFPLSYILIGKKNI